MRIGQGFDVHRFGPGDAVVLGGVRIPHDHGLVAHSDGDVLLHALCDALLGAIAAGDIGRHFPDTDARWKGADSRVLLRRCVELVAAAGYRVGNVDLTVIAERPRLAPHADAIRANIAADLGCSVGDVGVKATTTEGLGFTGRREGIAAQALVLLSRRDMPPT
jgi:2-C-methyl-D-erythritol 2,4-cyclodiphosphate synthase